MSAVQLWFRAAAMLRGPAARRLCTLALLAAGWPTHASLLEDTSAGLDSLFQETHGEWNTSEECKAAQWEAFLHLTGTWEGEWQRFQADDVGVLTPAVSYNATLELVYDPLKPYIVRPTMYYQRGHQLPSDIGEEQDGWFVVNTTPLFIDNFTEPGTGQVRRVNNNTYVFGHDSLAAGPPLLSFEFGIRRGGADDTERRRAVLLYDSSGDPLRLVGILMIWEAPPGEWYNRSAFEDRRLVQLGADAFLPIFYDGLPTVHQARYSLDCGSEELWEEELDMARPTYKIPAQEFHFWAPHLLQRNASTELGIGWECTPQWSINHRGGQYVRNVMVFEEGKLQYVAHDIIEVTNRRRKDFDFNMAATAVAILGGALLCGCTRRDSYPQEDRDAELELRPGYGSY